MESSKWQTVLGGLVGAVFVLYVMILNGEHRCERRAERLETAVRNHRDVLNRALGQRAGHAPRAAASAPRVNPTTADAP